jgi:hypothetical protein
VLDLSCRCFPLRRRLIPVEEAAINRVVIAGKGTPNSVDPHSNGRPPAWARLREVVREHFSNDDLAADIVARKTFNAKEVAAYTADLDTTDKEQRVLEVTHRRRGWGRSSTRNPSPMILSMRSSMTSPTCQTTERPEKPTSRKGCCFLRSR